MIFDRFLPKSTENWLESTGKKSNKFPSQITGLSGKVSLSLYFNGIFYTIHRFRPFLLLILYRIVYFLFMFNVHNIQKTRLKRTVENRNFPKRNFCRNFLTARFCSGKIFKF
jgi:hypothetical protein